MKRIFTILLLLVVVFSMLGCQSKSTANNNDPEPPAVSANNATPSPVASDSIATDTSVLQPAPAEVTPTPTPTPEPPPVSTPKPESAPTPKSAPASTPAPSRQAFNPEANGWYPYDTDNLSELLNDIAKGYVIKYNGQFWASPEFIKMISNPVVVESIEINSNPNASKPYTTLQPDSQVAPVNGGATSGNSESDSINVKP